ncbi:hypothetical protein [Bacteroides fluxus]|uniref:hypothetical protein n=1 Tax=Bacteroides fluxus TaxID=626930 RepID=UPI0023A8A355|nr:hypothetical protein [Bacteroides fluxus]
MEDVFKFLLVAAVMVIGLVRQFKKEARKDTEGKPFMLPGTNMDDDTCPPYPEQEDTYGGYIPEGPRTTEQPAEGIFARPAKSNPKKSATSSYTPVQTNPSPPIAETPESNGTSEYSIHSAEEARRAIIWSEILQRKY